MDANPATRAWGVDPPPALPPTRLRVDWPADGLDPFDVSDRRTQRVLFASGFTRAFPAVDGATPASDPRGPIDVIPMGYTTLVLLEKLAVVSQGRLVAEWPPGDPPVVGGIAPEPGGNRAPGTAPRDQGGQGCQRDQDRPQNLVVQFQRTPRVWAGQDPRWLAAARRGAAPALGADSTNALSLPVTGGYATALDLALALSRAAGDEPLMVAGLLGTWAWH